MSNFEAIAEVSETLNNLLKENMNMGEELVITLTSPDETVQTDKHRLNIYLYHISENSFFKNQPFIPKKGDLSKKQYPSLSLNLFYMITPFAAAPATEPQEAQKVLGQAMRIFHENSIVPEDYLQGDLKGSAEEIKLILNPVSLDDMTKIWNSLTKPFRLSVCYEVSVIQISSIFEVPSAKLVEETRVKVNTNFKTPSVVITSIRPAKGPPGTIFSIFGKGFKGIKVEIYIDTTNVSRFTVVSNEQVNCVLPEGVSSGIKSVKIIVDRVESTKRPFTVTTN